MGGKGRGRLGYLQVTSILCELLVFAYGLSGCSVLFMS